MPNRRRSDWGDEALRSDERRPRSAAVQGVVDRQFGRQTDPPKRTELDRLTDKLFGR